MRFLQRALAGRRALVVLEHCEALIQQCGRSWVEFSSKSYGLASLPSQTGGATSHPRRPQSNLEESIASSRLSLFAVLLA
jgi:hypothetical protein